LPVINQRIEDANKNTLIKTKAKTSIRVARVITRNRVNKLTFISYPERKNCIFIGVKNGF
jgi:hypothetical protein